MWKRPAARLWVDGTLVGRTAEWAFWCGPVGLLRLEESAAAEDRVLGEGRGAARSVRVLDEMGVWRQNRHGGALAGLLDDRYAGPGRLQDELALSEILRAQGLPTPRPLLALALRQGLWWRQHLVTAEIPDTETVYAAREDAAAVEAAGRLLTRLYDAGLWATDLHPGNLLWQADSGTCWVIDLAGASLRGRPLDSAERDTRTARFLRFVEKHAGGVPQGFEAALRRGLAVTAGEGPQG